MVENKMSIRELSAWVCLGTTILAFVPYFSYVFGLFNRYRLTATATVAALIAVTIYFILLQVIGAAIIAIRSKPEPKDERDVAIDSKSFRNGYYVLATTCFCSIGLIIACSAVPDLMPDDSSLALGFASQIFLFCFVLSEATFYLTRAVSYRRGF